jgi:hypothetical protein
VSCSRSMAVLEKKGKLGRAELSAVPDRKDIRIVRTEELNALAGTVVMEKKNSGQNGEEELACIQLIHMAKRLGFDDKVIMQVTARTVCFPSHEKHLNANPPSTWSSAGMRQFRDGVPPKGGWMQSGWGLIGPIQVRAMDLLAVFTRRSRTKDVYRQVATAVSFGPRDLTMWWAPKTHHRALLKCISKRFGCKLSDVITLDKRLRLRRYKLPLDGHPLRREVLFYHKNSKPNAEEEVASWLNFKYYCPGDGCMPSRIWLEQSQAFVRMRLTVENMLFASTGPNVPVVRMARACSACYLLDSINKKHKKCGECGGAAYCSIDCQRKHWLDIHRDQCGWSRKAQSIVA